MQYNNINKTIEIRWHLPAYALVFFILRESLFKLAVAKRVSDNKFILEREEIYSYI